MDIGPHLGLRACVGEVLVGVGAEQPQEGHLHLARRLVRNLSEKKKR